MTASMRSAGGKASPARIANERVPFPLAASWAGISFNGDYRERGAVAWCPFGVNHRDGGTDRAFRVYPDHGYCFAEKRWFSSVSLLAAVWEVSFQDAAVQALDRIGYVPATFAHLWEELQSGPGPDRESLALALREWCRSRCPEWETAQYGPAVAGLLSRCLGLLTLVKTEDDCKRWLRGCQLAMEPLLDAGQGAA